MKRGRGYFGIGMFEPKNIDNLGGIMRSAACFGANFVFTIGNRYKRQATDTPNATEHIPLFHYETFKHFLGHIPQNCKLIALEVPPPDQDYTPRYLENFIHPQQAVYLLGGEDRTLPDEICNLSNEILSIRTGGCLNVCTAASVVMYDRQAKAYQKP